MASGDWPSGPDLSWHLSLGAGRVQSGWQCPGCHRCYAPSIMMCHYCPAKPVTDTSADAVNFIAKGHLGTPCPKPRDGGLCGCDEADDDAPQDCLKMHCDH